MKSNRCWLLWLTVLAVFFYANLVAAQEQPPAAPAAPVAEPPPPATSSPAAPDQIKPGWFLVNARLGAGSTGGGGAFTFDPAPRGYDDESTQFSFGNGSYTSTGVEATFFPARGRHFLLSIGVVNERGWTVMAFDKEEYGYALGLHNRVLDYNLSWLTFGSGYRWLVGERLDNAFSVYGRLGFGGAHTVIDGTMNCGGAGGLVEVGGNWYHRFDGGLLLGFQADLRGWGAGRQDVDLGPLLTADEFGMGGGSFVLSLIAGWENSPR